MATFTEEELLVDERLGYPRAYAKLCRKTNLFNPYCQGPPFAFLPYTLQPEEELRANELCQMFPVIDKEVKPSVNLKGYVNLLWKQLDHLGNAGFDPAMFRIDPYGNVLYFHADSASPLFWDIDHWFPISRGGKTVFSNLRILQSDVCNKKDRKLEFLIPWWDMQLGISVNQFLSIFASTNSDFRKRGFSFLFLKGGNEELNELQVVASHTFPQHFNEMKLKVGIAPAAINFQHQSSDVSVLKSLNLKSRPMTVNSPLVDTYDNGYSMGIQKFRPSFSKENDNPNIDGNPYVSISMARDSLKKLEETKKKQAELSRLVSELNELKEKNETESVALQDLEALLIKKRRRLEKCRRLAESQSSYRALLEKMIRDAMHQSVVYKEQVRLNQAATGALMARLEAQRAICDSSEKELHKKYRQRGEVEKQVRPYCEQARKRSRIDDELFEMGLGEANHLFPVSESTITHIQRKELRKFLEEEQKASKAGLSVCYDKEDEAEKDYKKISDVDKVNEYRDEISLDDKLKPLAIKEVNYCKTRKEKYSLPPSPLAEDNEEYRNQLGKGNVEKWLQMLLDTEEGSLPDLSSWTNNAEPDNHRGIRLLRIKTPEGKRGSNFKSNEKLVQCGNGDAYMKGETVISRGVSEMTRKAGEGGNGSACKLMATHPKRKVKLFRFKPSSEKAWSGYNFKEEQTEERRGSYDENRKEETFGSVLPEKSSYKGEVESSIVCDGTAVRKSTDMKEREKKGSGLLRSESARNVRHFPTSPSVILGMRRSMDCIGKKPVVMGDYDDDNAIGVPQNHSATSSKFIRSCSRAIKKAVQ